MSSIAMAVQSHPEEVGAILAKMKVRIVDNINGDPTINDVTKENILEIVNTLPGIFFESLQEAAMEAAQAEAG